MLSSKSTAAKGGGRIGVPGRLGSRTPNGSAPTPLTNLLVRSSSRIGQGRSYRPLRGPKETVAGAGGCCGCGTPLLYGSPSHRRPLRIHVTLAIAQSWPVDQAAVTSPSPRHARALCESAPLCGAACFCFGQDTDQTRSANLIPLCFRILGAFLRGDHYDGARRGTNSHDPSCLHFMPGMPTPGHP